jgi:hypothetical protein
MSASRDLLSPSIENAPAMQWHEYKSLCDQPSTFSRWMLEQTIALVREETGLADALATVLCGPVLTKPIDHKGGAETDMFEVRIDVGRARAIHCLVQDAAVAGRRTEATGQRGLGGFDAAWREYLNFLER